jgi:hypothetical protein
MVVYYQETEGDYLAVETNTNAYYRQNFGWDHFEGRAAAISGHVDSVCTTGIARAFLLNCKQVPKSSVPSSWLKAIGY